MTDVVREEFIKAFEAQKGYKPTAAEFGDGFSLPYEDGAWWGWKASQCGIGASKLKIYSSDFIAKTNHEVDEWMDSFYTEGRKADFRLHCQWAWQEQERRKQNLIDKLLELGLAPSVYQEVINVLDGEEKSNV